MTEQDSTRHHIATIAIVVVAAALFAFAVNAGQRPIEPTDEDLAANERAMQDETVAMVNAERVAHDLEPLQPWPHNDHARAASTDYSQDAVAHRLVDELTVLYQAEGPVLGFGEAQSPSGSATAVRGLMNSPGHRDILLHEAGTHIAVGTICRYQGTYVSPWTSVHVILTDQPFDTGMNAPVSAQRADQVDEYHTCTGMHGRPHASTDGFRDITLAMIGDIAQRTSPTQRTAAGALAAAIVVTVLVARRTRKAPDDDT